MYKTHSDFETKIGVKKCILYKHVYIWFMRLSYFILFILESFISFIRNSLWVGKEE